VSFLEAVTYWDTDKKNIHADWKMGTSNSMEKKKIKKKIKKNIYIYKAMQRNNIKEINIQCTRQIKSQYSEWS